MVSVPNESVLDGVVTSEGTIVVDRAQVTPLGVAPGSHVALTLVPGRRLRSYLGAGDSLGPVPDAMGFRQLRDELWKDLGQDLQRDRGHQSAGGRYPGAGLVSH